MIQIELAHLLALAALFVGGYGAMLIKIIENHREINDLKARIRECERRWERLNYE